MLSTLLNLFSPIHSMKTETFKTLTMKTMKHIMLFTVASLTATLAFSQVSLGVTKSTEAAVSKSVQVSGSTQAASNAAAKATAATTGAVSTTATKAAEVRSATSAAAGSVVDKSLKTTTEVRNNTKEAAN